MKKTRLLVLIALAVLALACSLSAQAGPAASQNGTPIAHFLDAEGHLHAAKGFSGSLDLSGYRMVSGVGEAPRFMSETEGSTTTWASLGAGVNCPNPADNCVRALAVIGTDLYVGGTFTQAGGAPANRIARWNGSGWDTLGNGVNSFVNAMAVIDGTLYVGGNFTLAGGLSANRIAQWNGSGWSSLVGTGIENGVNNGVFALKVLGSDLYVGGNFTQAGDQAANYIARWNGSAWSSLGSGTGNGVSNFVNALEVLGSDLYVGGNFTKAGGQTVNYIALWRNNAWSGLVAASGTGTNNFVNVLKALGDDLYVGGRFTQAGGATVNYIARWNGTSFNSLGFGVNNFVNALAI